jgi:anti-sigma-K factor RskA
MAAPPVDDHTEEFEQLAGLQALRALEGDELARFEEHAARCERCRVIVDLDRETLQRLAVAAPEMEPSPDFKARLMQRAAAELEATRAVPEPEVAPPAPEPIPLRPRSNVVPLWRRPWVNALVAIFVLGIGTASVLTYLNQVVASYPLPGSAPGQAVVLVHRNGNLELQLSGLADPQTGRVYEAWIIPNGQQPIAAGTTSSGSATLPLPPNARGTTVAVTNEPTPGVQAPTTPPIFAGQVAL